jgi:AraC-like DNA-binding protein
MNRAADLLKNRTLSIKGIAFDSGYTDLSNFYRDFKQVHGLSPRQARIRQLTQQSKAGELPFVESHLRVRPTHLFGEQSSVFKLDG